MLEKLNFIKQTASTCIRLMAPTSHFVGRRGLFLTAKIINNDDKSKRFLEKSNFYSYICKQNQIMQYLLPSTETATNITEKIWFSTMMS